MFILIQRGCHKSILLKVKSEPLIVINGSDFFVVMVNADFMYVVASSC